MRTRISSTPLAAFIVELGDVSIKLTYSVPQNTKFYLKIAKCKQHILQCKFTQKHIGINLVRVDISATLIYLLVTRRARKMTQQCFPRVQTSLFTCASLSYNEQEKQGNLPCPWPMVAVVWGRGRWEGEGQLVNEPW